MEFKSVMKLAARYPTYDPVTLVGMFISRKHAGKKVVIVTGIKR